MAFSPEQQAAISAAVAQGQRTWRPDPQPSRPLALYPRTNPVASKVEIDVASRLKAYGFDVTTPSLTVPHLIGPGPTSWSANPDIMVGGCVALEVDAPASLGGGPTHRLNEFAAADLYRDDCLRAAGVRAVVRLRLGDLAPVPETYTIHRPGSSVSADVIEALADAILDAFASAPYTVRRVDPTPRASTTTMIASAPDHRGVFSWRISSGRVLSLRLVAGRHLFAHISEVGYSAGTRTSVPVAAFGTHTPSWVFLRTIEPISTTSELNAALIKHKVNASIFRSANDPVFGAVPFAGAITSLDHTASGDDPASEFVVTLTSMIGRYDLTAHGPHDVIAHDLVRGGSHLIDLNPELSTSGYRITAHAMTARGLSLTFSANAI